ncbi:MAG TPA: IPT/TIG domain-containing protein [Bryobacteraceae bacterium]|nr:IPT/TIG domain-containing protein [Bryobacteraceae bacterium]
MGDLFLQCSSPTPGAVITGNYTLTLPVSITNRIASNGMATDAVLSIDYGTGFTPLPIEGMVSGDSIAFNGVSITVPVSGNFSLRFANVRGNVHQLAAGSPVPVLAGLSVPLQINQAQIPVANVTPGLYATLYSSGVSCTGSQLPANLDLTDLFAARTVFFSTRVTEGFGGAFAPQGPGETNGTRFLVTYSGFPPNATLYVPNYVAGSDAATPTAGGDLGQPQAAGQYTPGSGALLLALVQGADATGAGGTPLPTLTGSSPVTFNSVTQVPLTNGSGYAVYEVVAANSTLIESAQFPTFLGLTHVTAPAVAQESISLAPVSNVTAATATDPVPRFSSVKPASDCSIIGDCQAPYFPKLSVVDLPVNLTASAGGSSPNGYIYVQNAGGGEMAWSATVHYAGNATGWLSLYEPATINGATITVTANAQGLAAGTYQANVVIDAGPLAGNATIPVTLVVQSGIAMPPPSAVTVSSVVNAATFATTPLVAGSLATVKGSNMVGANLSVTFDGLPATLIYTSASQINLQVPPAVANNTTANLVVTVNGTSSAPVTVQLAPAWPAIFGNGVLNQDNSVNSISAPAASGTILQIFATGIPTGATVTAQIGTKSGLVPQYAGPAPGLTGVQQVNLAIPAGLAPQTAQLTLCAAVGGQQFCSPAYPLYMQ